MAVAGATPAHSEKLRVGLVDSIDGYGLSMESFAELHKRLVAVDASGALGNSVYLERYTQQLESSQNHSIDGVCGRPVRLPDTWTSGAEAKLYRGVVCGPMRPQSSLREQLIGQPPEQWAQWRHVLNFNVPNDVVVMIDNRGGWHVACDWDANLEISGDELFTLPAGQLGRPHLFHRDDAILMMQAKRKVGPNEKPENIEHILLQLWTINGTARDKRRGWNPSLLSLLFNAARDRVNFELIWLDVGEVLPSDLTAAMHAAKRLNCDVVLVNTIPSGEYLTDMTQLLGELSFKTGVAIISTQRTTASPNFLIHPSRTSVPDLAEFRFANGPEWHRDLEQAIKDLLLSPRRLRDAAAEKPGTDHSITPNSLFKDAATEIGVDRFQSFGDETYVAARIPLDAIDGRLQLGEGALPVSFSQVRIKMYDVRGRRISGSDHGNGVVIDRAPPLEVPLSRGGYLVAPKKLFWMGKTWTLTDPQCRLIWSTGGNPVVEKTLQRIEQPDSFRLLGRDDLPETLEIADGLRLARLHTQPQRDVPTAVLRAASHLLDRGPAVRSWWYRAAPRHGSIEYRPVFQEVVDHLPTWDDSHLQYWTFLETGWLESQSSRMGDLGLSTPQTAWILVQATVDASLRKEAPRLVQSLGVPSVARNTTWNRTFHESHVENPKLPESGKMWVDQYEGFNTLMPENDVDVMYFSLRATDAPGPAIRYLRTHANNDLAPKQRDWLWYYDHDAAAELLQQRLRDGASPPEALRQTVKPVKESSDMVAWRLHLLALDQPSIRKQHLDRVIESADQVLQMCRTKLGGLPAPEDPYRRDLESTMGAASHTTTSPTKFSIPTSPAGVQAYAWAADAAYRKVRAIGYRELPDVVSQHPITDWDAQNRDFETAFTQLCGIVNIKDPRFVLALVRYERRRGRPNKAYEVLWRDAFEGPAVPWYFKKERDLWGDADWEPLRRLGHARWFLRQANQPVMH